MNPPRRLTLGFVSLGCAKNLVDSEHMIGVLRSEGLALAPSAEEADIVVVNTCAFIRDARDESMEAIRDACALKKEGPCRAVVVAGCLSQRYRQELLAALPEVDAFIGLDELDRVGEIARRLAAGERGIVEVSAEAGRVYEPLRPRVLLTDGPYAYLKIAEGCNHRCGFCAIPSIRGRWRSRSVEGIVAEARDLIGSGIRELLLISQDVTAYGRGRRDGADLAALLRALGRMEGRYWIRLLYGYPANLTDALLAAMAELPNVCRYLDIPVQHSHPDVLKAMRRADTIEAVATLAVRARAALPGVALRTTCLVGYPGETEPQFEHLLAYVRAIEFDHLGVFAYSREENTPAFAMPRQVDPEVALERRRRLMLAQQEIVAKKARGLVGRTETVLIEKPAEDEPGVWVGRSARLAPEVDGQIFVSALPNGGHEGEFVSARNVAPRDVYDMDATAAAAG